MLQPIPFTGLAGMPTSPGTIIPDDAQRIQASPADFGAGIGQAMQQVGQSGEQLGNALFQANQIANQNQVNEKFVQFQQGANKILYGDPDNPSQPGYYSLQGKNAVDGYAPANQQLEQLRQSTLAQLPSGRA